MKTKLLKPVLLAASILGIVSSASGETVHASIPHEFFLNGKAMPAGIYTVRPLSGTPSILLFVNEETREKALAFARTVPDTSGEHPLALLIKAAERSYEVGIAPARSSTKKSFLSLVPAK